MDARISKNKNRGKVEDLWDKGMRIGPTGVWDWLAPHSGRIFGRGVGGLIWSCGSS